MSQPVFRVDEVHIAINKTNPPQLSVAAIGTVSSSGWKEGVLVPRIYILPPQDGIQDLDFRATPPSGLALEVLTPIAGDVALEMVTWLKGVRVHAATNSIEALLTDEKYYAPLAPAKLGNVNT